VAQLDQDQPTIRATVRGTTGTFTVDGVDHPVTGADDREVRGVILQEVTARASMLGRPVVLVTEDDLGQGQLLVHPDGKLEEHGEYVPTALAPTAPVIEAPAAAPAPQVTSSAPVEPVAAVAPATAPTVPVEQAAVPAAETSERRVARKSFLAEERREQPATTGWRGVANRFGGRLAPSADELDARADEHAVSQHWPGPRTIAIVNGKGGASKTPTTALLSAVFARYGGAGVLAWDNNETRGTLGWRTEQGPHEATVQTLLPESSRLISVGAQSSDLAHFVHHQTRDKYDVLRSNPNLLATEQKISADDFDALHEVAAKYYRLIFVDSGNDESAEHWLRMIDHTDQLVIASTALGEHAEAGALLLEALHERDERSARLADNAVVVVSQSEKSTEHSATDVAGKFGPLARAAVTIPFDDAMHSGKLRYDALGSATQRAWLAAAAAVARGL
jgi:MinD-like ATPase involved in chromosome partitioning or flagellar assembly